MSFPAISVLLPAKNAAATVGPACQSILEQTFERFELIVVDDHSTDETLETVRRIASKDARVRILGARGHGLVAALRQALLESRAPLVARMDADDISLPRRLEASVAALAADATLGGVGTQIEVFREDRPVSPNMRAYAEWISSLTTPERLFRERFVESPLCHPSVVLRRAALEAVGPWEDGDFPEDYHLWLRMLAGGFRLTNVPEVLLRWRDSEQRLTRTDGRYAVTRFGDVKAQFLATGALAGKRVVVWGAGQTGLALTRKLVARGVHVVLLVDVHPRKVGQRIMGIPVVAPDEFGPADGRHLVSAVGAPGARDEIRAFLAERGWTEGRDFTVAA